MNVLHQGRAAFRHGRIDSEESTRATWRLQDFSVRECHSTLEKNAQLGSMARGHVPSSVRDAGGRTKSPTWSGQLYFRELLLSRARSMALYALSGAARRWRARTGRRRERAE